jgi:type I restriction enzyme, S subunit
MSNKKTTPPLRGTPSEKGNHSPSPKGWQAKPDGVVPRLRFPEFKDAGEWEEKRLDDFATIVRGGSPRPIDEYVTKDTNGLNWLKIGDIEKESKFVTSTQEKVIPAALTKTRVVNPGDLILSNSMSFGRPYILKIQTCIHDGWIAVSEINKSLDRDYLYYLMMTSDSQTYFSDNAAGSGVQNLNAEIIKLLPVSYPHKKEQQKIADCLSSIDDMITAQTQKLNTLKTHKTGLMQQLFPAEGETLPNLRFPEFQDAGEWEKKKLGQAATFYNGKAYKQEELLEGGKYQVLRVGNFFTNNNWYYSDLEMDDTKYCDNGDLLYAWSASFGPRIWQGEKVIYHYHIWKVIKKVGIDKKFLFITLEHETEKIKDQSANGLGLLHITKGTIEAWESSFPIIDEQQKIADCLSSIDDLVTAQTQKLSTLKTHKKALTQQLFPALDEMQR